MNAVSLENKTILVTGECEIIRGCHNMLSPEQTALLVQSLEKLQDFFRHEEAAVEGETNG